MRSMYEYVSKIIGQLGRRGRFPGSPLSSGRRLDRCTMHQTAAGRRPRFVPAAMPLPFGLRTRSPSKPVYKYTCTIPRLPRRFHAHEIRIYWVDQGYWLRFSHFNANSTLRFVRGVDEFNLYLLTRLTFVMILLLCYRNKLWKNYLNVCKRKWFIV